MDGVKDVAWWHPAGKEMTPEDWQNGGLRAFGMVLSGASLEETDVRGRRLKDPSFLVIFNGGDQGDFVLPPVPKKSAWRVEWSTAEEGADGQEERRVKPGEAFTVQADTVTVLRSA